MKVTARVIDLMQNGAKIGRKLIASGVQQQREVH